jgi:hypothetical protein
MKSAFSLTLRIAILVGLAGTIPGTAQASDWDRSALLEDRAVPRQSYRSGASPSTLG